MTGVALDLDRPLALIGDVHGQSEQLRRALEVLVSRGRQVVLLGDYVNRGSQSREVLNCIAEYREALGGQIVAIRGNHELALLRYLESGDAREFLTLGGAVAIRSYQPTPRASVLKDFVDEFPPAHRELLVKMPTYAENSRILASHAGFNPTHPRSRADGDLTLGRWPGLFNLPGPGQAGQIAVFGHYVQRTLEPFVGPFTICLDTGCGSVVGAPLTALLYPEFEFRAFYP